MVTVSKKNSQRQHIGWLAYYAYSRGLHIQHRRNGSEKQIGPCKVDRYYELNREKVVLKFHGCFWHGCPKCFSKITKYPISDEYEGVVHKNFGKETVYWGRRLHMSVNGNVTLNRNWNGMLIWKKNVQSLEIVSPLEPRDAFFVGRTEAFRLYEEESENKQIKVLWGHIAVPLGK